MPGLANKVWACPLVPAALLLAPSWVPYIVAVSAGSGQEQAWAGPPFQGDVVSFRPTWQLIFLEWGLQVTKPLGVICCHQAGLFPLNCYQ